MDDLEEGYACGLDLGTTFSCIGVFRNGGVEIIPNRNGDKITPSIVTILDENKILKGEETLDNLVKNYDSTIYAIKRFIGRNFNDPKVKKEIDSQKFPFQITEETLDLKNIEDSHDSINTQGTQDSQDSQDKKKSLRLVVKINKNGKSLKFSLEEISKFIIEKMVENAREYLDKKIKKLVITVPANFTDTQRYSTQQAAELAGLKVLRIINEPTAAALAYGLQEPNDENKDGKILVFDLGGGTFDVTILQLIQNKNDNNKEQIFDVLATSGDKFLGGEDFDNKLVDYVLDKFCKDYEESEEEIRKNKKVMKRLKISCENIKKVLSFNDVTTLCINSFYNNKDIVQKISQRDFENLCDELFVRLKKPLNDALIDAKLTRGDIKQIILVGGSTRIPKIYSFLKKYFPNSKINNSINPDETVAYGATLMAAKIIIKDKFTSKFNLMDITPFSIGTNVLNKSKNDDIKKEGDLMSVIIKRGTKIPITNTQYYFTVKDNQTSVSVNIYEGEKKYVKYNHLLKEAILNGLTEKPAGKVKIEVKLFIDVNGILSVTAKEVANEDKKEVNNNKLEFEIKNDGINLTKEEMEEIKKKSEKYLSNIKSERTTDYYNLKESLKEYQDAYDETEDDEEKYNLLMGYNCALEEFINKFDKNFDNETVIEKFYIYVKQLFISYIKIFKIKKTLDKGDQIKLIENIINYADIFIILSSGYLDDLMEVLKDLPDKLFYEIVVSIMEKCNEYGKKCLSEKKKFCRYNSMRYFEKTDNLFKKYICDAKNILKKGCEPKIKNKCIEQMGKCTLYLKDINSNIILLCEDALKKKILISTKSGFTDLEIKISNENYQIALETYEKILPEYRNKSNLEEALILANMIKINFKILGNINYKLYYKWAEDVEYIAKQKLHLEPKVQWYSEFSKIFNDLKKKYHPIPVDFIKEKYSKEFDEIDEKFKNESHQGFINYILKKYPYNGYENDVKNKRKDFNNINQDLIYYLFQKYHPNEYKFEENDEQSMLKYCLIQHIDSYLNTLNSKV